MRTNGNNETTAKNNTNGTAEMTALSLKEVFIQLGDIEPYPYVSFVDLIAWIDALQARLKQMNVRGLDFFRLDVDWNYFTIGNRIYQGNWPQVKELEIACRQRKLPFSLIYWAADYDRLNTLKLADDATWYIGVMRQSNNYAFVGGAPDQYVIESWVAAPSVAVPETEEWTFTRSVRDFSRRLAMEKRCKELLFQSVPMKSRCLWLEIDMVFRECLELGRSVEK